MRTKVLSIAAALLLMAQGAWAQDATLIDGVYYVLNNEEKTAEVVQPSGFRYQGDIVVIADHAAEPMQQSIVTVRQLMQYLQTMMGTIKGKQGQQ